MYRRYHLYVQTTQDMFIQKKMRPLHSKGFLFHIYKKSYSNQLWANVLWDFNGFWPIPLRFLESVTG